MFFNVLAVFSFVFIIGTCIVSAIGEVLKKDYGKTCDCKREKVERDDLCKFCLIELELSGGRFCAAYAERARTAKECEEMHRKYEKSIIYEQFDERDAQSRRERRSKSSKLHAFVNTWRPFRDDETH